MHWKFMEIPQNHHTFVLLDSHKMGNLMTPDLLMDFLTTFLILFVTAGVIVNVKNIDQSNQTSTKLFPWFVYLTTLKIRDTHNPKSSGDLLKISKSPWFGMFLRVQFR